MSKDLGPAFWDLILAAVLIRSAILVVCLRLAFSALCELVGWWVAVASGDSAEAFRGTQGQLGDTRSDMALALLGTVLAVAVPGGWHDGQLERPPGAAAPTKAIQ